jgi:hypothetical protein
LRLVEETEIRVVELNHVIYRKVLSQLQCPSHAVLREAFLDSCECGIELLRHDSGLLVLPILHSAMDRESIDNEHLLVSGFIKAQQLFDRVEEHVSFSLVLN